MSRVEIVKRWFGVEEENSKFKVQNSKLEEDVVAPGKVVLISGASGSGKSSLLRGMRARCEYRWIDLQKIRLRDVAVVDCFGEEAIEKILERLSRVGLGEVWTYLRRPSQLSEGQRWRLRLAIALQRAENTPTVRQSSPQASGVAKPGGGTVVLGADEFGAVLDRVTAKVVARCVRKAVSASSNLCAVVATSHDDLTEALGADVVVRCDFGEIEIRSSKSENKFE